VVVCKIRMKKIYLSILSLIRSTVKIPKRISNLRAWHKIAWKDHQGDYSKLLEIMERKFFLQAQYWEEMGEEEKARYNRICQSLSQKVRTEHYLNELIEHFSTLRLEEYVDKHVRHMQKMYRKVSVGIDQKASPSEDQLTALAMDIASYKHRKAKRLLFKIMYQQLENWQS